METQFPDMNNKKVLHEVRFFLLAVLGYSLFVLFIIVVGNEEVNMSNILKSLPIGLLVIYIFRIIGLIMKSLKP